MVKISFNEETINFEAKFNPKETEKFDMIVGLCKRHHLKYAPIHRVWHSDDVYVNMLNFYDELKHYSDVVEMSDSDHDLLEDLVYAGSSEIKKGRPFINKALLEKFPPLVGKAPNENFQYKTLVNCLATNRHIINLDMGLGKTYICAMIAGHFFSQQKADTFFIICRPEGMEKTRLELLEFLQDYIGEEDIVTVYSDDKMIDKYFNKKIIITNYITFRVIGQYYHKLKTKRSAVRPKKKTIPFEKFGEIRTLVLDECQSMKHADSQQTHIVNLYKDYFDYRYLMSGSIGYKIDEYFSYFRLLSNDLVPPNKTTFLSLIAYLGNGYSDYQVGSYREDRIKTFKERVIDKYQTTYRSEDCLEIPPNIINKVYIKLTPKMRKVYQRFIKEILETKKDEYLNMEARSVLAKFNTFIRVTSDPCLLKDDFDFPELDNWRFTDNPKWEITMSLLDKYVWDESRRVCIRANNPAVLERIKTELDKKDAKNKNKKYKSVLIHGGLSPQIRGMNHAQYCDHLLENEFKKGDSKVILISNKKYYSSINLLETTRTIYWDRDKDPEFFDQSKKRSNRHGTTEPTQCDILLLNESLDIYLDECIIGDKIGMQKFLTDKRKMTLEDYKLMFNSRKEDFFSKITKRKRGV